MYLSLINIPLAQTYSTKTFTQKNLRVIKPKEFLVIIKKKYFWVTIN